MNTLDVLKEYLISIGFGVDTSSLNQAKKAMDSAGESVDKFSDKTVAGFAKGAAGFTAFITTVNAGLAKYLSGLGQADLQTQLFARRMWMSVDAARAYQSSMNALDANIQDLYLSPELMQRYLRLRNQALSMQMNDKEYEPFAKSLRDMTFEFQRLKLEGTYALQWIGYYLVKYIEPIFNQSGISLKSINDIITEKMPQWTQKVAEIASWFVKLGVAAWNARDALMAIMAVFMAPKLLVLATNPIFLMIAGLTTLLLLINDYKTWENDKSGKTSVFGKLWSELDNNETFQSLKQGVTDVRDSFEKVLTSIGELGKELEKDGALDLGVQSINASFTILKATLEGIAGVLDIIAGGLHGLTSGDWSNFQKGFDIFKNAPYKWRQHIQDELNKSSNSAPWENPNVLVPSHGVGHTSFTSGTGIALTSNDSNAPLGKRIYDLLAAYLPQIASALGVKVNMGNNGQNQSILTDFASKMNDFLSNAKSSASWVNYSPWPAIYGGNTNNNHTTQVDARSNYNIYGAKDPNTTGNIIKTNNTQLLTRVFKGVQV